jgi:bifunctional non-homologous end joining protein LigD
MSLQKYRSKRNVAKSHEPAGKKLSLAKSSELNFCVQKHAARNLHYDFRLEFRGVLLSWAVPKGPSLDPKDKRLAVHVEDHPLDYQYFEGVIPKGNYGAGTVEIWDHGTYMAYGATSRQDSEKKIEEGMKKGHFAIILSGEKLNGEFIFQKLKKDPEDRAWLLIKKSDDAAEPTEKTTSPKPKRSPAIKKSKIPDFIPPMLATLVQKPFTDDDWLFEIKWDGYRMLAFVDQGNAQLKSRSNKIWNSTFSIIVNALQGIKGQAVFDGELVVVDAKGKSQFQLMQNYTKTRKGTLCYYVFDLLFKDGKDLRELPLIERKEILKKYLKELALPMVFFSDHVFKDGEAFFKAAVAEHLEGIIGKKITSSYQSKRSREWVKIKSALRQEVVIGGFTAPRGSRQQFGALLVGVYNEKNELEYVGHVGGGFDGGLLKDIYAKLEPLVQKKCPFKNTPKTNATATWVKPQLICEVSFTEWTQDNSMRHPIFHGMREDKAPKTVRKDLPEPAPVETKTSKAKKSAQTQEEEVPSKTKKTKKTAKSLAELEGLALTNLDKIYWPKEKYTKGDLLDYYKSVSVFILPYLKNRPIMLRRYPDGIEGNSFYQKNIAFSHPEWLKTTRVQHEGKVIEYIIINDLRSLLYAVNLGSIDLHPFMSTTKDLDRPDYCVIDLDPHGILFDKIIEVALAVHELLDNIGVKNICKTSGGNGLHILIPLKGKYTYEQSRQFAEIICQRIHEQFPKTTSMERDPKKRPKMIYLDCLQNRIGQTIAAPYSVRPRPKAPVSTPLEWKEVGKGLDPRVFTIKTVPKRLEEKGDLFTAVLKSGVDFKKALKGFHVTAQASAVTSG